MSRFFFIYSVFVIGFSQGNYYNLFFSILKLILFDSCLIYVLAFYIANNFGNIPTDPDTEISESVFNSPFQSIMDVFVMSLSDVIVIYQEISKSPNSNVAKVNNLIFLACLFVCFSGCALFKMKF